LTVKINHQKLILDHYAMRVWDQSHHGSWHLYGHSHGKLPDLGLSTDVGVDGHNFQPWSFEEVRAYFRSKT
jgi:calcineurin-like phosphoesterase family protein